MVDFSEIVFLSLPLAGFKMNCKTPFKSGTVVP